MKQKPIAVWISSIGVLASLYALVQYFMVSREINPMWPGITISLICYILSNVLFYVKETKQTRRQYKLFLVLNWFFISLTVLAIIIGGSLALVLFYLLVDPQS